jgi:Transposase, Mutator family
MENFTLCERPSSPRQERTQGRLRFHGHRLRHAEAAKAQWRMVADQLRPKLPKLSAFMDEAERHVLAYMGFPKEHFQSVMRKFPKIPRGARFPSS